jgi:hypothetical protein
MKKIVAAAVAALTLSTGANAATTIDVDGIANSSLNGGNAKTVSLAAGTYLLSFVQGQYTAFNRWSASSGCNASGGNCAQGFENTVKYIIDGTTYSLGDAPIGGYGPFASGGYFTDAATSLAHAATYSASFTLANPTNVSFFIYDDFVSDNAGGVSLSLAQTTGAVPEPATWAMMILGFGVVGGALRRRRQTVRFAAA